MTQPRDAWKRAAEVDAIPEGQVVAVRVERTPIALYKVEGQIYATHDICTHELVSLSDGYLAGCIIECPLHQGRFDIRTGKALCEPVTVDLPVYPVRVIGHEVFVRLDGET